jgi:hypothetical protein
MKTTIAAVLVAAAALSGCATTSQITDALKNRVACTAAKDKAYFLSLYWRFGISAEVDEADAKAICK